MSATVEPVVAELLRQEHIAAHEGRIDEAQEYLRQALSEARRLRDRWGEANVLFRLGAFFRRYYEDEPRKARPHLDESLRLFRRLKSSKGIASALIELGTIEYREGKLAESEKCFAEASELYDLARDRVGQARVMHQLGLVERQRSNHELAERYFRRALLIFEGMNDRQAMGTVLLSLGASQLLHHQNHIQAQETWEYALRLLEEAGDHYQAQQVRENLKRLSDGDGVTD